MPLFRVLRTAVPAGLLLLACALVGAAHESSLAFLLRSPAGPGSRPERSAAPVRLVGEIVVIEDDGTMIRDRRFVASRVMPAFYSVLPDSFDSVSLFGASSFPREMYPDAAQYKVRAGVAGTGGHPNTNRNGPLGIHTRRLRSIQFMNDVRHYGPTPDSPIPRFPADFTGVELLASEMMHAYGIWIDLSDSPVGVDLIGRNDHWSLYLNSDASVMEGCRWRDNGDGTFTSLAVLDGLSELDEYLLGVRAAEEVAPTFVIANPEPRLDDGDFPLPGLVVRGDRVDVGIEDIVAHHGPRVPAAADAPKTFRMAFVLVVPAGARPPARDVAFLERFRTRWEQWFREETEGRGTMDTRLARVVPTADFETDRIAGNSPLTVRFRDRSDGTVEQRIWDFGDGSPPSVEPDPVHVYADYGVYDVALEVRGAGGSDTLVRPGLVTVAGFRYVEYDDFETTSGWEVGAPDDAERGHWEQGDPEGTTIFGIHVQPEHGASGERCWVTGLRAGDYLGEWDIDGGTTTLLSSRFDLAEVEDPYVSYARWYSNDLGPDPDGDELVVQISSDDGATWAPLETVVRSSTVWRYKQFRVADHVLPTEAVRLRFLASDLGEGSLVEAGVDVFEILGRGAPVAAEPVAAPAVPVVRPNPFDGRAAIRWNLARPGPVRVAVYDLGGRLVRVLEDGPRPAGPGETVWDGRDGSGRAVASGVYAVRVETAAGAVTRKVVRVR